MPSEVSFTGVIQGGKLRVRRRGEFDETVAQWKDGTEIVGTLEKRHARRSQAQNAYYWSVVVGRLWIERLREQGWTEDDVHFYLKARFLSKRLAVCDGNGEIVDEFVLGGSTTKLNIVEFCDYVDRVVVWAGESLGIAIPPPDPLWRERDPQSEAA